MAFSQNPGLGYRRYDEKLAAAETIAKRFAGLDRAATPGKVLAAFKGAAEMLGVPGSLERLVDELFKYTDAQDWEEGAAPIVWPSNEKLAHKLRLTVRQVQKLLRLGVDFGLLSFVDSPNGHRGGRRDERGRIIWAYGISLSPLGVRYGELVQLKAQARAHYEQLQELKRRRTIARKSIAQIAQTAIELGLKGADWLDEVELSRMAVAHARQLTGLDEHRRLVEQLEARRERLAAIYMAAVEAAKPKPSTVDKLKQAVDSSCTNEADFTHITTTNPLFSPKGQLYSAWREERSDPAPADTPDHDSVVEMDLDRHKVDPAFITNACREICWDLAYRHPTWAEIVAIGQNQARELSVPAQAWNEACRIMGRRGAAAAMIALTYKANAGLVEKPGAYLRGMTKKALTGELALGRSFHGILKSRSTGDTAGHVHA